MAAVREAGGARLAALALALPGCIPSNVVATEDRMVATDLADAAFEPAPGLLLEGLYESVDIRGEAAASLRKIYYLFAPDGTYTAAALGQDGALYAFQTLSGTWHHGAAGLVLDGGEPVTLEAAGDLVRLTAPTGVLVMQRRALL